MSQLTPEQAREIIARIRRDNGGISAERRRFLKAVMPDVLDALTGVRRKLAGATKILVNNLYSKDTRFLYELIQNAEDNTYSKAAEKGEKPFLTFKIYADKIIIDSNEDGFSERNVSAICSVGESTKANSEGYIGEKGIGFKSVFKVAQKVLIQSHPFSFVFEHTRETDDDGLGMVTPDNADAEEAPPGVRTRMVLTLKDSIKFDHLVSEFRSIPDTLLLFLRQLQLLTVEFHPQAGKQSSEHYAKRETRHGSLYTTFLTKSTHAQTEPLKSEKKFYTTKTALHDLPYDEARLDKKGNSIAHATVVLAFPVDDMDTPVLEQQHTFAFLPLRRVGFNFLVQSDFVTQANREDVVNSTRNRAILKGVAQAFRSAMVGFYTHPSLRYQWMRYLPQDSVVDEFWKGLTDLLKETLKETPLLESWSGKGPYIPTKLQRLQHEVCDGFGNPLLADLANEVYLSRKYTEGDFQILKQLGTQFLSVGNFLDRLEVDLGSANSRWRSMTEIGDWRTRMCNTLLMLFPNSDRQSIPGCLQALKLIPMYNNTWRPSGANLFFHSTQDFLSTQDVPIPTDLNLSLVNPIAFKNDAWIKLLVKLGVTRCASDEVIKSISVRYSSQRLDGITQDNRIAHIRYLYWFLPQDVLSLDKRIRFADHNNNLLSRETSLYFPDVHDSYSPAELFKKDGKLPGYSVHYLHSTYLEAVDATVACNGRSWIAWLEDVAGVCRAPKLCGDGPHKISGEFQYIIKYRSDKFLGTLKCYWAHYKASIADVAQELSDSEVDLENSGKDVLTAAFLPFPKLKRIAAELHVDQALGFISMSEKLQDEELTNWKFLEQLNYTHFENDLFFYSSVLITFVELNQALQTSSIESSLYTIYNKIQSLCHEDLEYARDLFSNNDCIYVPPPDRRGDVWVAASECVWSGPPWLKSKQRLNVEAYQPFEPLFKTYLQISDASQADILEDLVRLKETATTGINAEDVKEIYDHFYHEFIKSKDRESCSQLENLRNSFEDSALVYVPHEHAWVPPSRCVWADSHVVIPGQSSLATAYSNRKTFFTRALKVPEPSTAMYIKSLKAEASGNKRTAKLKEIMALISRLGVKPADVESLAGTRIFPIRLANGETCLASASSHAASVDFAIIERLTHDSGFSGKIAMLDFSIEDIRDIRPFLLANGLENRFSSTLVKEITDVKGGVLEQDLTNSLRLKTRAIVRCVLNYAGPKRTFDTQSLYRIFRQASVFSSDRIRLSMRITQSGKSIESAYSSANFHLDKTEEGLYLYLPKDEDEREVCFERQLPRRLCDFLNINDKAAEGVIGAIFRKDKPAVIEKILVDAGVAQVDCDFELLEEQLMTDEPEVQALITRTSGLELSPTPTRNLEVSISTDELAPLSSGRAWQQSHVSNHVSYQRTQNATLNFNSNALYEGAASTTSFSRSVLTETQISAYKEILEDLVNVARKRAGNDVFEVGVPRVSGQAIGGVSYDVVQEAFGYRSLERDFKLGVAGELYMFEYLKGLELPGFGLANWMSEIRDRVASHPDYHGIRNIVNRDAIADIEYTDHEGKLTDFLIQKGHLEENLWADERPHYHFEVKATISGNWQEPFFMSKNQERHIREAYIGRGKTGPRIYVICRIFNIGRGEATGMLIYVDPEARKRSRQLEFVSQTWAVKPMWYLGMQGWKDENSSTSKDFAGVKSQASKSNPFGQTESVGGSSSTPLFGGAFASSSNGSIPGPSTSNGPSFGNFSPLRFGSTGLGSVGSSTANSDTSGFGSLGFGSTKAKSETNGSFGSPKQPATDASASTAATASTPNLPKDKGPLFPSGTTSTPGSLPKLGLFNQPSTSRSTPSSGSDPLAALLKTTAASTGGQADSGSSPLSFFSKPAAAPASSGLFSSTSATAASTNGQTGSGSSPFALFSKPAAAPTGSGLFSNTSATAASTGGQADSDSSPFALFSKPAAAPTGSGLFSSTSTKTTATASGLFGTATTETAHQSTFGHFLRGNTSSSSKGSGTSSNLPGDASFGQSQHTSSPLAEPATVNRASGSGGTFGGGGASGNGGTFGGSGASGGGGIFGRGGASGSGSIFGGASAFGQGSSATLAGRGIAKDTSNNNPLFGQAPPAKSALKGEAITNNLFGGGQLSIPSTVYSSTGPYYVEYYVENLLAIKNYFQSITLAERFQRFSFEELRLADYAIINGKSI